MINSLSLVILVLMIFNIKGVSQNCTAHASHEFIELSKQMAQSELRQNHGSSQRSFVKLGIKFWDLHGSSSTIPVSYALINDRISSLNSIFSQAGVQFEMCGEINWGVHSDFTTFDIKYDSLKIQTQYYDPNSINLYIGSNLSYANKQFLGFAYFPNQELNSLYLDREDFLSSEGIITLIHEMGHFFGLHHTHTGSVSIGPGECSGLTDELPDGTNCIDAGDFICDTPADPGMFCLDRGDISNNCQFFGFGQYSNWNPDVNNYMAYIYSNRNHCLNHFTQGQYTRMFSFVSYRENLVCNSADGGNGNCADVFEPNNSCENASQYFGTLSNVPIRTEIQGKIGTTNDIDFYKINFSQKGNIEIILTSPLKNYDLYLYKGCQVYRYEHYYYPRKIIEDIQDYDLNSSFYIVVIHNDSPDFNCSDQYKLTLDWLPIGPIGGDDGNYDESYCPWEGNPNHDRDRKYEPNNSISTAFGLEFEGLFLKGGSKFGYFLAPADVDYYRFTVHEYGSYYLGLNERTENSRTQLQLFNQNSQLIANGEPINSPGNFNDKIAINLYPGTYYAKVFSRNQYFNCEDWAYGLTIKRQSQIDPNLGNGGNNNNPCSPRPDAVAEPNETFAQAFYNPSFMNVTTNGHDAYIESHIATSTDVDLYRIEFQMGVVMRWQLCAPQNSNATFTIYDVNGYIKHEETASNCSYFYNSILSAGTYYVKIRSVNGQFNCTAPYQFHFTVLGVTDNGGGNNNNLTCAGAFELEMNKEWSCGNAWYLGCPVYTHGSTQNLPDKKNTHNCSAATWSGGEKVYKVTARDQNVCNGGVGVQLNNYTGNPEDWGVFLYTDCALTNCRPHASYWDFGNGEIEYHFEVPDGEYYVVIDNVNSAGGEYDIFTNSLLWPSPPNDVCNVIFNGEDPIPFIDYSDDNDACSCSLLENPTISQSGSVCSSTGALLQSSTPCSNDPNIEVRWYSSIEATVPIAVGTSYKVYEPGLYYAEVYNTAMGCGSSRTPIQVEKPPLAVTAQVTNASCMGDGQILLSASGPNPISSYSFRWSTGDLGYELDALSRGIYTVTVTDTNGCSTESSYYIESDAFDVTLLHDNSDCIVSPNRNLYAAKSGESKIANILWNTGDTTNTITTPDYGIYKVTITDVNGCTASDSIWIENKPFRAWANINKPSCHGLNDGSISLSALDGVFPYRYEWGNGGTVFTIDNLSVGSYSYTITDSRGCQIDETIIIDEPDSLVIFSKEIKPTCWDSLNGSISVFPKGGTPFYNYRWNNGASENEVTHLDAGMYNVTITDWKNCEQTMSIIVSKPDSIDVVRSVTNVSCFGLADGAIDITAIGGTLPFRFDWKAGDTLSSLRDLIAGSYNLTITDANGCQKSGETIVIQPEELKSTSSVTHVKCYGGSDGSFTLLAQGGTPPYNYDFSSGNGINLPAGRYSIIISDLNNCINLDTIIINEPYPLEANITASNVSCAGFADGSISADVVGGTSPYQYNWNGNSSLTNSVENLYPGEVTVQIIDSNNCLDTRFVTITEPEPLVLKTEVIDESCVGNLDGSITVFHEGGTLPISVLWSNGGNTNQNKGISSGSYTVTIVDNNGCILDSTIYVNSLPPLTYELNPIPVTCSYTSDGQLYLENIKGVQPLSITIDNGQSSQITFFENLEAGNHEIVMIDGNNCKWIDDFEIGKPLAIEASILASSDSIQLGEKITLSVSSPNYTLGEIVWQPQNLVDCSTCTTVETQPFFTQNYVVIVRNDTGCEQKIETLVKVSRERKVFVPNVFSPNGDGINDYFTIFGGIGTTNIKSLRILDRYGNIVFDKANLSLNNLEQGWDGMHKGNNAAASGVYVYVAEMEFVDGEVIIYKGDVTLLK